MARDIPQLFGYHGNELRFFDELLGGKEDWRQQVNPNALGLYGIRFLVLSQPQDVPGFRQVLGPVETTPGGPAYLYEATAPAPYVHVASAAAKAPDADNAAVLLDERFPWQNVVLYPDTASVAPEPLGDSASASPVTASVTEWRPGRMRIALEGRAERPQYLFVSENWYKDWRARVDGQAAPVHRGQYALLSVVLPPGATEVELIYDSPAYRRGRLISLAALLGTLGFFVFPLLQARRRRDG
jgi:hypothetical protein